MSFLCNACFIRFDDSDEIKDHYKSEFHDVNLKRRVAELPPISYAIYMDLKHEAEKKAQEIEEENSEHVYICDACNKTFYSEGQLLTHNQSSTHKKKVKAIIKERRAAAAAAKLKASAGVEDTPEETADNEDEVQEAEPLVIGATNCVYCWLDSGSLEANLDHMWKNHSFFIPDRKYCADIPSLIEYLHAKVIEGHLCTHCDSEKQYESPEAARQHMIDTNHCRMRYEEDHHFEEYEQFYDYSNAADDECEEGETPVGEVTPDGHLQLPGGRIATGRYLQRYYKQRYRAPEVRTSVLTVLANRNTDNPKSHALIMSTYRPNTIGVRGNNVNETGQRYEAEYWQRETLNNGINMNQIRRRYFRIADAKGRK